MTKKINVLVVSSKYEPEYAGSGIRARVTYKRLSDKFPVTFEVLSSSVTQNRCGTYFVDGRRVVRIAMKLFPLATDAVNKDNRGRGTGFAEKLKHGCNYLIEAVLTWKYLIFNMRRFDLIHIFGKNWVTAAVVTFIKVIKKPMIIELCNEVHTPYHYEPPFIRMLLGEKFPKDTAIVAISKALEDMCLGYGYKDNVWGRPNPVDTKKFFIDPAGKAVFRKKYTKFSENDILLLCVSKFRPSKNQIFLLDVIKRLPGEFKLLLAGPVVESGPLRKRDQEYLDSIRRSIKENGLEKRVQLEAKFISNVAEYLKMSDVFLFPTTTEALGTPMLEAFCCGMPVVANRIPKVTDYWIEDGKNGFVSALDAGEFAEKIIKAARIDKEILRRKREETALLCSSDVVDWQYFDLIRKLTHSTAFISNAYVSKLDHEYRR